MTKEQKETLKILNENIELKLKLIKVRDAIYEYRKLLKKKQKEEIK